MPGPGRHGILQAAVGAADEDAGRGRRIGRIDRLREEPMMWLGDGLGAVPGDLAGAGGVAAEQVVEAGPLAVGVLLLLGVVGGRAEHERVGQYPGVRAPLVLPAGRRVRSAVALPGDRGQVQIGGGNQRCPGRAGVCGGRPAGAGGQREQAERSGVAPVEAHPQRAVNVDAGPVQLVPVDVGAGERAQFDGGPVPFVPDVGVVVGATAANPAGGRVARWKGGGRGPGPLGGDRAARGEHRIVGLPDPRRLRGDRGQAERRGRAGPAGYPRLAILIRAERQPGPTDVVHGVEDHSGLRIRRR